MDLKVIVSWTYNKGYGWEDLLNAPEIETKWLWESDIKYFSKTDIYDLVITIGV